MKKKRSKSKRKSMIFLSVLWVVVLFLCVFAVAPVSYGKDGINEYTPPINNISLGLDLQGGVYAIYEAKMTDAEDNPITEAELPSLLSKSLEVMKARLRTYNFTDAYAVKNGAASIRVEIPNVSNSTDIFSVIGKPANIVVCELNTDNGEEKGDVIFSGENIVSAEVIIGNAAVSVKLDDTGRQKLSEASQKALDTSSSLYFWVDDTQIAITVSERITDGNLLISGLDSDQAAEDLAVQLRSGSLKLLFEEPVIRQVSPTVGEDTIKAAGIAGLAVLVILIAAIFLFYRAFGFAGNLSLLIFGFLFVITLSTLPWIQLTLPGIAGIVVAFILMADANIIIFERIKEEYRSGKTIIAACDSGYRKSLFTILDAHVIALLVSIAFWAFGSAFTSGFAMTLFVGVVLSAFCSLVLTRFFTKRLLGINTAPEKYNLKKEVTEVE